MLENKSKRVIDFGLMGALVVVWIAIDQLTKACFDAFEVNSVIAGPFFGIFDITLVHNTGAAWGIFNGNAIALGIFSLIICVLAIIYVALVKPPASLGSVIGLSLIVAGGIGNAIDRFINQYVIDFIRPVFIDFPVFNIADIGVTIGVVIFVASLLFDSRNQAKEGGNE